MKLTKEFDKGGEKRGAAKRIAESLQNDLKEFMDDSIPLMLLICNPGMQERHWEEVEAVSGISIPKGGSYTLSMMTEIGTLHHIFIFFILLFFSIDLSDFISFHIYLSIYLSIYPFADLCFHVFFLVDVGNCLIKYVYSLYFVKWSKLSYFDFLLDFLIHLYSYLSYIFYLFIYTFANAFYFLVLHFNYATLNFCFFTLFLFL